MPDFSSPNLWAAAIAVVLAAVVSAVVSLRASKSKASKDDLDTLSASYSKLQATYLIENDRLNAKVDKLQNEKDALLNKQTEDKAECLRQIIALQVSNAELQTQLTTLMLKMPDNTMVRQVEIVAASVALPVTADTPLPVEVIRPLPLPMTAAQVAQAKHADEVAAGTVPPVPK